MITNFYLKRSLFSTLLLSTFFDITFAGEARQTKNLSDFDYFINLSLYAAAENIKCSSHDSKDKEFAFAINPVISKGKFTLEYDGMYGENRTNYGPTSSKLGIFDYPSKPVKVDYKPIKGKYKSSFDSRTFKHGYARLSYNDIVDNQKVVVGDVSPSVTFGNMQGISGLGFAITSYNGMFDFTSKKKVNSQSSIVLMYPSKVEIKHNGCTIQTSFYIPGTYSVFDLAPEARAGDGYEIKITDPMNRSYVVCMDLYGDKEVLPEGKNEYELLVIWPHKFDSLDVFHKSYDDHCLANVVYRWAVTDRVTASTSLQTFRDQAIVMVGVNAQTDFGLFSQSLGLSYSGSRLNADDSDQNSKEAFSYEAFYRTPWTILGRLDILFSVVGKGYSNLGRSEIKERDLYKQFTCLVDPVSGANYENQFTDSQVTHLNIRYAPVKFTNDITFAIAYDMVWHEGQKDHSYDLCIDFKQNSRTNWAFGVGLTKRDSRVDEYFCLNGKETEKKKHFCRRFYIALDYKLTDQFNISSSYDYDNQRTTNYSLTYKPKQIKGLELEFNPVLLGGSNLSRSLTYKAKYECEYFDTKVDFANKIKSRNNDHIDKLRLFFNTSFNNGKFKKLVKTHYMFTNSLAERQAKKKK